MRKALFLALALIGISAHAADRPTRTTVDLRDQASLAQLKASNPAHFEKIQKILEGLEEDPQRAESDWLQVQFEASDVFLARDLLKTSNPPRQLLQFTLDDVRYRMHLTRRDLSPSWMQAK
jgi:hypothetical protein